MAVRLALAAMALAIIPTLDILANFHDARGGVARVAAFVDEKPFRSAGEQAMLWDYMGTRMAQQQQWPEAAEALGRSVDLVPAPRVLSNLGLIEIQLGRYERARGRFRRIVQADPDDAIAWHGYAAAVARLDQPDSSRLAATQLLRIDPADREALELMRYLDARPK
jgi:tetratricopeptide (TPR) repeat protein